MEQCTQGLHRDIGSSSNLFPFCIHGDSFPVNLANMPHTEHMFSTLTQLLVLGSSYYCAIAAITK